MTNRCLPSLAGLALLALALTACDADDGSLLLDAADADGALEDPPAQDEEDDGSDLVVLPPDHVEVFVGDELLIDIPNEDPETLVLRPVQLPEGSEFELGEEGGILHWIPEPEDIGTHDVVFLHADIDNPSLVLFSRTLVVDVLPRFDLIEYGF